MLLRPAAVKSSLVSEICKRFQKRGLTLGAMRMLKPGAEHAKQHLEGLKKRQAERRGISRQHVLPRRWRCLLGRSLYL